MSPACGSIEAIEIHVNEAIGQEKVCGVALHAIHHELAVRWMVEDVFGKGFRARFVWWVRTMVLLWKASR